MSGARKFQWRDWVAIICLIAAVLVTALTRAPETTRAFIVGLVIAAPFGVLMWLLAKHSSASAEIGPVIFLLLLGDLLASHSSGHYHYYVALVAYGGAVISFGWAIKRVLLRLYPSRSPATASLAGPWP